MMSQKTNKIIYYSSTILLTILMLFSAGMYFLQHRMIAETFTSLGYPTYIICPLAIAKTLGVIAIWIKKSKLLTEWAYAGFFFDVFIAFFAHIAIGDGEFGAAAIGMVLVVVSRIFNGRISTEK